MTQEILVCFAEERGKVSATLKRSASGFVLDFLETIDGARAAHSTHLPAYAYASVAFDTFCSLIYSLKSQHDLEIEHFDNPTGVPFLSVAEQRKVINNRSVKAPIFVNGREAQD